MSNKVYLIAGPTAVGKSSVAIELAKKLNGEIVNCDSVQVYKYLDIGSAKPNSTEMQSVKHHLFSIVDPDYNMTVATYQKLALACIDNILERGKTPVICGGTGLYINAILYDMDFAGNIDDGSRRTELEKMAEENGNDYMHQYLTAIDPESAKRIHPNNIRKVIRAIEAFELGDGIKSLDECPLNPNYDFKFYALKMDREPLYERINERVDDLISRGLLNEVQSLVERGYKDTAAMKSIGYKELVEYINGETDLETAIDNIKKNTRHYAKRQYTWFNRYDNVNWINVKNEDSVTDITYKIFNEVLEKEGK